MGDRLRRLRVRRTDPSRAAAAPVCEAAPRATPVRGLLWAELMRRTFGFDVLARARCGGRLQLIALIEQATVITRILRYLGLPTDVPASFAARSPPTTDSAGADVWT